MMLLLWICQCVSTITYEQEQKLPSNNKNNNKYINVDKLHNLFVQIYIVVTV